MNDERAAEPEDDLAIFGAPPVPPGVETPEAETAETGKPDAETPADEELAHPALRALAFLLDGFGTVVVTVAVVFGGIVLTESFESIVAIFWVPFLSAVLATVLTALAGLTPGKAIVGIRVVGVDTGRPVGGWAILRSLVIVAPLLINLGVSWLAPTLAFSDPGLLGLAWLPPVLWTGLLVVLALRPRHRGLQDLAGRSIVVRRTGLLR